MPSATVTQQSAVPYDPKYGLSEADFNAAIAERNRLSNPNLLTAPSPQVSQQTRAAQTPTSNVFGGGSGGSSVPSQPVESYQMPEIPRPSDQEINQVFDPLFGSLGQAENLLKQQFPQTQQLIGSQADTSRQQLSGARESAIGKLGEQRTGAQTRSEDAIAASRRLFNELQQGNIQRFGGASSAGLAASELQGREFQRNKGATQRELMTAMREIDLSEQNVEREFQVGLQEIENRKQQALVNAQNEFNQRMLDIASERGRIESEKAAARLQALQDFRNTTYQIQLQQAQFAQQLAAQRDANQMQLSQSRQALSQYQQSGQDAANTFQENTTVTPQSQFALNFDPNRQATTYDYNTLTGQIMQPGQDLNQDKSVLDRLLGR